MRMKLKILIPLLIAAGFIIGMNWMIAQTEAALGMQFGTGGYVACYAAFFIAVLAVIITGVVLYYKWKKDKNSRAQTQVKFCPRCGAQQVHMNEYGWYCKDCMRYD